jgi:prepilin-type N-terminal cleavage/methylation domain-containing protein
MFSMKKIAAFTLIELLIAVAILGILAAISYPAYREYLSGAEGGATNLNFSSMRLYMEDYRMFERGGNDYYRADGNTNNVVGADIETVYGWRPDGGEGIYTYTVRPYMDGTTPTYDVWATADNSGFWSRCDDRLNSCCYGTDGTLPGSCP